MLGRLTPYSIVAMFASIEVNMPPVVLVSGVFDVLHPGHIALIGAVREAYPDAELVIGINGDRRTHEIKECVAFTAEERASLLSSVKGVDRVVVFEEDTPAELLASLKPTVFVKGPDWDGKVLPEAGVCAEHGIEIVFMGTKSHSSTELKRLLHVRH